MFRVQRSFSPGWNTVQIKDTAVVEYDNSLDALRLGVVNHESGYKIFLIFSDNTRLIKKLLDLVYDEYDEEVDEQDLVGLSLQISLVEKAGYLKINDIRPSDYEFD